MTLMEHAFEVVDLTRNVVEADAPAPALVRDACMLGENPARFAAEVFAWCDAAYLEDGDEFYVRLQEGAARVVVGLV